MEFVADTLRTSLCDSTLAFLEFTNQSCVDLVIDSLDIQDPLSLTAGQLPMVIKPGESKRVEIRFVPDLQGELGYAVQGYFQFMSGGGPIAFDSSLLIHALVTGGDALTSTSDTTIDLGAVSTCTDTLTRLLIPSIGCDSLRVLSWELGPPANGFEVRDLSRLIEPGREGVMTIGFEPPAVGTFSTVLLIKTNGGTRRVTLIGQGVEGTPLTVTTDTTIDLGHISLCNDLDFGLPIPNIGCDSLRIEPVTLSGDAEFSVIGLSPATLGKGEEALLRFHFKPTRKGIFTATLTIVTNGGTRTVTVVAHAIGGEHALQLIPNSVDFGAVSFCDTRDTIVQLKNIGCDTVVLDAASLSELLDYSYVTETLPIIIPPGSNADVHVHFDPVFKGDRDVVLTVRTTDIARTEMHDTTLALTSRVVDGSRSISSLIASIDFGELSICEERDTMLTISNPGCDTLIITAADLGRYFATSDPMPVVIPPGGSHPLSIQTIADTAGLLSQLSGTLSLISNSDSAFAGIQLNRGMRYPTRLRLEAVENATGTAGQIVRFRVMLEGEVPPTLSALHFNLHHNNDLLSFVSVSGAGLIINSTLGERAQVQHFSLAPVTAPGVIGELTFKAFLTADRTTPLSFSNIRIDAAGVSLAPECLAVVSDTGSLFTYEFGCGEEIVQRWLETDRVELIEAISPNPASRSLVIETTHGVTIELVSIVDQFGAERLRSTSTHQVDVSSLPSGVYYVRVKGDPGVDTRRVIIER